MSRGINYLTNRFEKVEASPFVRRRRYGNVQILVYHRVAHRQDSFLPSIPLPVFEKQMECLARHFHVLELSEAVCALEQENVPRNAVVVTFDDGYLDNFEVAYPVLTALSLPATIFLTTGVIGTDRILWHDRVFRIFQETEATSVQEFGPEKRTLPLDGPLQRTAARIRVLGHLKRLEPGSRDEKIDQLAERLGEADTPSGGRLMLSWEEVREMHRGGISFGSHTVTHPVLSRISPDRVQREVVESRREIERRLGTPITMFAYPNGRQGDFDETTKRLLKDAGYECALTTVFGSNSPPNCRWDRFELRRGGPDDADPALFEAKMNAYKFLS
jgi:peptidoglycan/xylan/chitin deacetylase (PgdA/CDA1 family)